MKKRIICLILCMLFSFCAFSALASDNIVFEMKDDVLYIRGEGVLDYIPADKYEEYSNMLACAREIVVEEGITEINGTFSNYTMLKKITLPVSLKKIGIYTFRGCIGLKTVFIPDNGMIIEGGAFERCTSLEKIYIPQSVTLRGYLPFGYSNYDGSGKTNLTIYTQENSSAHKYAVENDIKFEIISPESYNEGMEKWLPGSYQKLYIDYFANMDIASYGATGFVVAELSGDDIPEVITISHTSGKDMSGITYLRLYTVSEGNVIEHKFTSVNGRREFYSAYLPDDTVAQTDAFVGMYTDEKTNLKKLVSLHSNSLYNKSVADMMYFDGNVWKTDIREYDNITDVYSEYNFKKINEPVCSSLFGYTGYTGDVADALDTAFDKYEKPLNIASHWAYEEIEKARIAGIVTNDIINNSHKDITREEFCEMVVRLYRKLSGNAIPTVSNPFEDTYNQSVIDAYALGIVNGVTATQFNPYANITRQEMCVMLDKCMKKISSAKREDFDLIEFTDNDEIAQWAKDSVNYIYGKEIIKGKGNNCIKPLDNATCQEAVLLVYRTYINIIDK